MRVCVCGSILGAVAVNKAASLSRGPADETGRQRTNDITEPLNVDMALGEVVPLRQSHNTQCEFSLRRNKLTADHLLERLVSATEGL